MPADRDVLPDREALAHLLAQLSAVVDEACEIHENPHPMIGFRDYLLHRLGTYGHAHDVWSLKEAIEQHDRLTAEVERLRKFAESAAAAFHDLDYEPGYLHAKAVLAGPVDEEDQHHA